MKRRKILLIFICCLIIVFSFCGVACKRKIQGPGGPTPYSDYTPEEHVQRITEKVSSTYKGQLPVGDIVSFSVYNVYPFYDDYPYYGEYPTLFLIEFVYKAHYTGEIKYTHALGEINCYFDEYYLFDGGSGKSFYSVENVLGTDAKLFFASYHFNRYHELERFYGYEKDGEIILAHFNGNKDDTLEPIYQQIDIKDYYLSGFGINGYGALKLE